MSVPCWPILLNTLLHITINQLCTAQQKHVLLSYTVFNTIVVSTERIFYLLSEANKFKLYKLAIGKNAQEHIWPSEDSSILTSITQ